jgi:BirA family biotin operon repressor/biotin-[acetyl-CoA-carboxylase] ligase
MQRDESWPTAIPVTRFTTVRHVAVTGSTNDDVAEAARTGTPEGLVVVADRQTAGRGRLGRTWEAPSGSSLLLSILLRPALALDEVHLVASALGVAAVDAVRALGVEAGIKWPNDLVVERDGEVRKLSGMLAETVLDADALAALVIGIGINVSWPDELPPELASIAVSLNHIVGGPVDRVALFVDLLERFEGRYGALGSDSGRHDLLADYRRRSATLGRRVEVDLGHEKFVGDAFDVTAEGHLLVIDDCPDRPRTVVAGDVVHVRH